MNATSCKVTVLRQSTVAADIRCLTVQWPDASRPAKAGQFFMLRAWAANETPILSRPISVHDFDAATGALTFLYQVKGEGTQKLAALKEGDTLTVTGPCGNGFDVAAIARAAGGKNGKIAVVGGGIGTAPLLQLASGDQIHHKTFGDGLVISVTPMGGDALLEVAFDTVGTKKLMLKTAGVHITKL